MSIAIVVCPVPIVVAQELFAHQEQKHAEEKDDGNEIDSLLDRQIPFPRNGR